MAGTSRHSARQKHGRPAEQRASAPSTRELTSGEDRSARRGRTVRPRPRTFPWLAIAGVVLVAAIGIALYRSAARNSVGESVTVLPATHVSAETQTSYNSNPPTSGSHTVETAPWGVSTTPLPDISLVHNLEHGGIVLHYRPDIDEAQRQQLATLAGELQRQDSKIVLAPRTENDALITATAWGKVLKQESFNSDELRAFFSANINRGPERVP
jgi:hypothetical protein